MTTTTTTTSNNNTIISNKRRNSSAEVLASTAGRNNWKTWAGRTTGNDNYEFFDIFRGINRKIKKNFIWTIPPPGTACPVCLCCEPADGNNNPTSNNNKEWWHITSSCGHAVCINCLKLYSSSQINDPQHVGPLKCPICSLPLRERDAIVALQDNDDDMLIKWDKKIRDELLRALPNYRHCPNCSNNNNNGNNSSSTTNTTTTTTKRQSSAVNDNNDTTTNTMNTTTTSSSSSSSLTGGGFVTSECLAPINEQREKQAKFIIDYGIPLSDVLIFLLYLIYVYIYNSSNSSNSNSNSNANDHYVAGGGVGSSFCSLFFIDLFNILITPMYIMKQYLLFWGHYMIAKIARYVLYQPIIVVCPCCDKSFILNAESELSTNILSGSIGDDATKNYINKNTRPCPSCSVPISKIDGCNHMKCTFCRTNFCWACMKVRTFCSPYSCNNGAPYGNANIPTRNNNDNADNDNDNGNNGDDVTDVIVRIERQAATRSIRRNDMIVMIVLLSITIGGRNTYIVQTISKIIGIMFAIIFSSTFINAIILIFIIKSMLSSSNGHGNRGGGGGEIGRRRERRVQGGFVEFMNNNNNNNNNNNDYDDNNNNDNNDDNDLLLFGGDRRRQQQHQQRRRRNHHHNVLLHHQFVTEEEMVAEAIARSLREQ